MLRRFGFVVAVLCALAMPVCGVAQIVPPPVHKQSAQKDGRIGTVIDVEGAAAITPVGGMPATVKVNTPVYLNDIVQTGKDARVFILFIDNTNIVLSGNTLLRIDKYVYDPDDATSTNNNASYTIEGAFEYVSGLIGHRKDPDVHVNTPVGAIGIRGTDFWAGPMDDQYDVAVNEGQVSLKTNGGEAIVNKGEGTYVKNMFSRPARAQRWNQARFRRMAATVRLKNYAAAVKRMHTIQKHQPEWRKMYGAYVRRAHPHWIHKLKSRGAVKGLKQGLEERGQSPAENNRRGLGENRTGTGRKGGHHERQNRMQRDFRQRDRGGMDRRRDLRERIRERQERRQGRNGPHGKSAPEKSQTARRQMDGWRNNRRQNNRLEADHGQDAETRMWRQRWQAWQERHKAQMQSGDHMQAAQQNRSQIKRRLQQTASGQAGAGERRLDRRKFAQKDFSNDRSAHRRFGREQFRRKHFSPKQSRQGQNGHAVQREGRRFTRAQRKHLPRDDRTRRVHRPFRSGVSM